VPQTKPALRVKWGYTLFVFYTYILKLSDNTFYTGFSENLKQRISAHQDGLVSQTKNHRPIKLVYYSAFESKKKALDFEKYLKSYSGFAFRNKHLI
jgi:putative endonuclease